MKTIPMIIAAICFTISMFGYYLLIHPIGNQFLVSGWIALIVAGKNENNTN